MAKCLPVNGKVGQHPITGVDICYVLVDEFTKTAWSMMWIKPETVALCLGCVVRQKKWAAWTRMHISLTRCVLSTTCWFSGYSSIFQMRKRNTSYMEAIYSKIWYQGVLLWLVMVHTCDVKLVMGVKISLLKPVWTFLFLSSAINCLIFWLAFDVSKLDKVIIRYTQNAEVWKLYDCHISRGNVSKPVKSFTIGQSCSYCITSLYDGLTLFET